MKEFVEEQLNALLLVDFAPGEETSGFKNVSHDGYIEGLQRYLSGFGANWVEQPRITIVQGLSDRGVDLTAEFRIAVYTAGFQVKSYNDIEDSEFSQRLWQQIGQSGSYPLDRLYIILCGDMTNRSHYQKIRGFLAGIEQGNYLNITVIAPEQAWQLYLSFNQPIDAQQVKNHISRNITRFLKAIGKTQELYTRNSLYRNLERLYIPPAEYPAIERMLQEHNIVFIAGAPHLGKTYTAVKLMYDRFLEGYQPFWLLGRITSEHIQNKPLQEAYHEAGIQDTFSLESVIRPGNVVYLEDPFGRTEMEELRFAESLFSIIELLRLLEHRSRTDIMKPKVILTSRESIFRRAVESQPELSNYVIWLRAGMDDTEQQRVSYNFKSRADLAEKYMHFYIPEWTKHSKEPLPSEIEKIEHILSYSTSLLWTPHSIQRFYQISQAASLQNEDDIQTLREYAIKAENIAGSFADEIALLPFLHQLVLVFIYLTNYGKKGQDFWLRRSSHFEQFLALVVALGHDVDQGNETWQQVISSYPSIIEQLENLSVHNPVTTLVHFAHPAYGGAVSTFLSRHPEILDAIFANIQSLLSSTSGTHLAEDLVKILSHWYQVEPSREAQVLNEYLATNDRQLLMTLADNYTLRYAFTSNIDLKTAIRRIVGHSLAQGDNNLIRQKFITTAHTARSISMDRRCEILLLGISNNPLLMGKIDYRPYDLICRYYNEVSEEARLNLHHHLQNNVNARQILGRSFGNYYDFLPQNLQQVAQDIANDESSGSFLEQKELVVGLILGFGQYNTQGENLLEVIARSNDHKIRAYLASALVLIYDQLDERLRGVWADLVRENNPHCVVAVVERIIALSTEQKQLDLLKEKGLVDFALNCTESSIPLIRAETLRILLEYRDKLSVDDVEPRINQLLQDDNEQVRGAALYWMLSNSQLQAEYPTRLQDSIADTSIYSNLSKLLFFTNARTEIPSEIRTQIEELKNTPSMYLRNALLFHVSAQAPFLSSSWNDWLQEQKSGNNREIITIVSLGEQHHANDGSRPIFEPNWLTDYENPMELIWLYPPKSYLRLSTGHQIIVKKPDELNLISHVKDKFPDYLEC